MERDVSEVGGWGERKDCEPWMEGESGRGILPKSTWSGGHVSNSENKENIVKKESFDLIFIIYVDYVCHYIYFVI